MINILPQTERRALQREYFWKYGAVITFLVTAVVLFVAVTLVPSYIMSNVKEEILSNQIAAAKNTVSAAEETQSTKDIRATTEQIRVLTPNAQVLNDHDVFLSIVAGKTAGIKITSFSLVRASAETAVTVSGVASDRQTLLAFQKKLDDNVLFTSVDLPISNLTKSKDIIFTVKLKGKF